MHCIILNRTFEYCLIKINAMEHHVIFDGTSYWIGSYDDSIGYEIVYSTNNFEYAEEVCDKLNTELENY